MVHQPLRVSVWRFLRWAGILFLLWALLTAIPAQAVLLVDNFEQHGMLNLLGNPANTFGKGPSRILAARKWIPPAAGHGEEVLMLKYIKKDRGGPADEGGWCGYYTLLKIPGKGGVPDRYLDASQYKAVTLWVRGDRGGEKFVVGLVDRYWDRAGDSARSADIGKYLPEGKVTTEWQKARVPFSEFLVNYRQLAALVIMFEADPPAGRQIGTIYIDNITLE